MAKDYVEILNDGSGDRYVRDAEAQTALVGLSDEVAALKQRVPVTVMGNTLVFATDAKVSVSGTTIVIG